MLGFLINEKEVQEIEHLIKREMDEILFDLQDERIDHVVKKSNGRKVSSLIYFVQAVSRLKSV